MPPFLNGVNTDLMKPRRRWFRFSLMTLLVLITLVACGLGWGGAQLKWIRERNFAKRCGPGAYEPCDLKTPWQIKLFGAQGYKSIYVPTRWRRDKAEVQRQVQKLKVLFPEAEVSSGR